MSDNTESAEHTRCQTTKVWMSDKDTETEPNNMVEFTAEAATKRNSQKLSGLTFTSSVNLCAIYFILKDKVSNHSEKQQMR